MFLPDVPTVVLDTWNGAITRLDQYSVPKGNGFYALNCAYLNGQVATRLGHSTVFAQTDGAISALANWVIYSSSGNNSIVVYYATSIGVRGYIQLGGAFFTLMAVPGATGAVLVPDGGRMYATFYDSTGKTGFAGAQVFGQGIGADPLFFAPMTNVPTVSETTTGLVTAGVHRIGYLATTRNGFTTNLAPVSGSTFTPVSFTSTGGQNLHVVIGTSPAIPTAYQGGVSQVQIVMTTSTNLDRYFTVPGAVATLNPSTGATLNISISDDDLAATGTDVTDQRNLLVNGSVTAPFTPLPITPWAMFTYSSRMCYCTFDGIYISERDDYQHITSDQHLVVLEGRATPVQGFSMRGVAYIGTQFGFFSTEDNGDVPVTWTPPQKVDGSIGILSPTCIAVNQAAGYACIASERGLYIFQGGVFPPLPISYYQQDWARINWTAPTQVQVVDDRLNKRIIVQAPLFSDSLGTPTSGAGTYQMTWDYTEGDQAETVKYSIDMFASYSSGAVGYIQNINNSLTEVWYAPTANGNVIRQNDGSESNPYRDVTTAGSAAAINSLYRTGNIPGEEDPQKTVNFYHGAKFRVHGNGSLGLLVLGVDGVQTTTPVAITLATAPGIEILRKWFLMSEQASIQFGLNNQDQYFIMARIEAAYTNAMPQR